MDLNLKMLDYNFMHKPLLIRATMDSGTRRGYK